MQPFSLAFPAGVWLHFRHRAPLTVPLKKQCATGASRENALPQDPIRQLLDLVAVHGFYLSVLELVTGEEVPVPRGAMSSEHAGTPVEHSISVLRRWLNILDLAIAPPMFRDALKDTLDPAAGEALLRYYVLKTSHTDTDRDKCDFVNTHLYRSWRRQKGLSPAPAEAIEITPAAVLEYEGEIYVMLGDVEPPGLPEEHLQLAREFDHLRLEVDEFFHFDQIMDSGILARVREIKASFGKSFYHPHVLAEVAVYNTFFGHKFDELFLKAASDIKSFAQNITLAGGSIMTRLNDEVTVKELADVQGEEILHEEYGKAREKLRKVAQFKKVVDNKRKGRYTTPLPDAPATVAAVAASAAEPQGTVAYAGEAAAQARPAAPEGMAAPSDLVPNQKVEDHKVEATGDMIRNFIAAADKTFANVVPLRNLSLLLTPGEVDAFRNAYLHEKSFRADYAGLVRRVVSTAAAMQMELEEYKKKRNSAYLWKQHADSLKYLLSKSAKVLEELKQTQALCERRGLAEKVKLLEACADRLRNQAHDVARQLQS